MGCGASSNPQISPRPPQLGITPGIKLDPSFGDKENRAPKAGEESHDQFMTRYAEKAAARKEGKPVQWDDKEKAFRNQQLKDEEQRKQESVKQLKEVDAPDWVKERALATGGGEQNGVTAAQAVEAATWASRVIFAKKAGDPSAPAELALHLCSKIYGDGGARAKGFGYDKAFDGDLETYYNAAPNGRDNAWVGLQLEAPTKLTRLRFHPRSENASRMAGGTFEGSTRQDPESDEWTSLHVVPAEVEEQWYTVTWDRASATPFSRFRYIQPCI